MNIKLTPIPQKKKPKNKYLINVEFMSGDADHFETVKYWCKDEEDFKNTIGKIEEGIEKYRYSRHANEDEYDAYWYEVFGEDFVPYDVTSQCDYKAATDRYEGFYFDEHGVKFKAELT